ncbi:TPA: hypothetical protein HA369_02290, partial [Candidatus Woesearchaeota archaeon]|nr:hypothetical protein [Candidatus Woesearchaeota archaeon]
AMQNKLLIGLSIIILLAGAFIIPGVGVTGHAIDRMFLSASANARYEQSGSVSEKPQVVACSNPPQNKEIIVVGSVCFIKEPTTNIPTIDSKVNYQKT